ncbi:MAG TPA: histidine--tRNA ligase [Polyangiaceae bacterium]|jgi:histidyl-tRNA synthetase|nr:histidine--tRNA ligase [Polyangiaceae bacterium]
MSDIVKPRAISGFPEWLPEQKIVEERMLRIIVGAFERFGFAPIETPAVERIEVLTAKGVAEKEIYALTRLAAGEGEDPSTELALHFDLTVPLARYVAQHFGSLTFPFRRYQIQKVWRGERPQAGRFREFYQCDIDIVGNGELSLLNDAEIPCVIDVIFRQMQIGRFVVRINNRKLLQGIIEDHGAGDIPAVLRAIDALEKIGADKVAGELEKHMSRGGASELLALLGSAPKLDDLDKHQGGPVFAQGLAQLREVVDGLIALGMPEESFAVDVSIARGLDYYTGTVYETRLVDAPEIGSVCSGGRYDDLATNYTKQRLPGVGISIGLTRLLSRLFDAGLLMAKEKTPAPVLVTVMDRERLPEYLRMAAELRGAGIATELFTEPKKLKVQLRYADQKGFRCVILAGDQELAANQVLIKNLATAEQTTHPRSDLVPAVTRLLRE